MTTETRKAKVSVTISRTLLSQIDNEVACTPNSTRSGVIESWLRQVSRKKASDDLESATIAYYDGLTENELAEDDEWTDFSTKEFKRFEING